jgi:hypothetical protein
MSMSRRSSWRTSTLSNTTYTERSTTTMDVGIQTDFDTPATSPSSFSNSVRNTKMTDIPERRSEDRQIRLGEEVPQASIEKVSESPKEETSVAGENTTVTNGIDQEVKESNQRTNVPEGSTPDVAETHKDEKDAESDEEEEQAVVHTVQQAATPQRISKARLVSVKKQTPPALPPRNPIRDRRRPLIITGDNLHEGYSNDQGTSPISRNASVSSIYKSETEQQSSRHSMSSVDLGEEMKNDKPLRPSVDEVEGKVDAIRSPSSKNLMPGQFV